MDRHAWDERYAASELVWSAEPNVFLVEEVEGMPPGRALDIAAGEGRNAIWLARRGWDVTAVDFSEVALDKARRLAARAGVRVDWVLADVTTYAPEPGGYDLVIVLYLHLPAPERRVVLRSAASALAPGGTLLVVGHHARNLAEGVGGPQDPSVLYGEDDVVADLPGELAVERATAVMRPVGDRSAVDVLVRASRPG